ncbi:hypothetical protein [Amycolatopsis sp. lyj-23]|uniref:hypothetical protein n=1 Tax=Amycolatopsis sp. lyj-23 TaxID=2789283 RepID=UPI003979756F
MTDSDGLPDKPGTPPIRLAGLIADAYTDALLRLAHGERDRHDWTWYRRLGYDMIGAGAQVLIHACARHEQPTGDPRQVAAEVVHELRTSLGLAEHIVGTPPKADLTAEETVALAEDCAQAAGRLYRLAAELSPAAIAATNPLGNHQAGVDHNTTSGDRSDGEST